MANGGFLIGFELADAAAAEAFLARCPLIEQATSFGGTHTAAERRARWGDAVPEGFIRLSVGIEPVEVLWSAIAGALEVVSRGCPVPGTPGTLGGIQSRRPDQVLGGWPGRATASADSGHARPTRHTGHTSARARALPSIRCASKAAASPCARARAIRSSISARPTPLPRAASVDKQVFQIAILAQHPGRGVVHDGWQSPAPCRPPRPAAPSRARPGPSAAPRWRRSLPAQDQPRRSPDTPATAHAMRPRPPGLRRETIMRCAPECGPRSGCPCGTTPDHTSRSANGSGHRPWPKPISIASMPRIGLEIARNRDRPAFADKDRRAAPFIGQRRAGGLERRVGDRHDRGGRAVDLVMPVDPAIGGNAAPRPRRGRRSAPWPGPAATPAGR